MNAGASGKAVYMSKLRASRHLGLFSCTMLVLLFFSVSNKSQSHHKVKRFRLRFIIVVLFSFPPLPSLRRALISTNNSIGDASI